MTMRTSFTLRVLCLVGLMGGLATPAACTSADINLTEPVPPSEEIVSGNAVFGIVAGQVYNSFGNLGATFDIGNLGGGRFYFFPDILTWIKNPNTSEFEPRRVEYTLEVGYFSPGADHRLSFFIKHQSFHDVDSFDGIQESYELYGARYLTMKDPSIVLRVGKYLDVRTVDYDWDFALSATSHIGNVGARPLSASATLHSVTEKGSRARNGFTDYSAEISLEFRSGIDLFLRYETMHDINRFAGTTDHHGIVGTRYVW